MKIVTNTSYEKLFKYLYSLCKNGTDALISKEKKEPPVENILRLVVRKSPTGESTHYFFRYVKVEVSC